MKLVDALLLLSPSEDFLYLLEEMMQREPRRVARPNFELYNDVDAHVSPKWIQLLADLQDRKFAMALIVILAGFFILKGELTKEAKLFCFAISVGALIALVAMGDLVNRERNAKTGQKAG